MKTLISESTCIIVKQLRIIKHRLYSPTAFLLSFIAGCHLHTRCMLDVVTEEDTLNKSCTSQECDLTLAPEIYPIGGKLSSGTPQSTWQLLLGGLQARHGSPLIPTRPSFPKCYPACKRCTHIPEHPNGAEAPAGPEEEPLPLPHTEKETVEE